MLQPTSMRCRHGVCTLSDLPLELMVKVIGMASPEDVWQQGACKHAEGRQAVGAARVPGPLTQQEQASPNAQTSAEIGISMCQDFPQQELLCPACLMA